MNDKRIALGILTWFLGIIVPVFHHVALHAAIAREQTDNIITRMQTVFDFLPWIDRLYLALMFGVGAILVTSGLGILAHLDALPNLLWNRPTTSRPGFEVITDSERSPSR